MQRKTIHIQERPEHFDQWLTQFVSERGFAISVNRKDDLRWYSVKRDGEAVAELETLPVGNRLRLRTARLQIQYTPDGMVKEDFIDILDKALQADYCAEPIEIGALGSFVHGILDLGREHFDNPEDEAKRQSHNTELSRGLPPIAQSEPATAQDASPGKQGKQESRDDELHKKITHLYKVAHLTDPEIAAQVWVGKDRVKQIRYKLGLKGKPRKKTT